MGAGHDLATAELARRLEGRGYATRSEDYLRHFPLGIGLLLRWIYGQQLKRAPWTYEATFRIWFVTPWVCRLLEWVLSLLTARRLLRLVRSHQPAAIVCTYPLQSLVLGRLRRRGRLQTPLVTFITDFGVHPLWMHPGVDLTVCIYEGSARVARTKTTRPVVSTGPMVNPRFGQGALPQAEARRRLGLPAAGRIALVVAGSWGVGDIEATFREIAATGRYLPVVVCGRNEEMRRRLDSLGLGRVIGWTDQMYELMSAADVLVQNAGGLSCSEAFALELPVVTYHPIAGHGRKNAVEMEAAGVTLVAANKAQLAEVLDRATGPHRPALVAAGRAIFTGDPAAEIDRLARQAGSRPSPRHPARAHRRRRRLAGVAALLASGYLGTNLAVNAATAHGLDLARPELGTPDIYVGVRIGPAALADPALAPMLATHHLSAVVDGRLARAYPGAVRSLARHGVDVVSGGWLEPAPMHFVTPTDDLLRSTQAIQSDTGRTCRFYAPDSGVSGVDLASALVRHLRIVRPSPGSPGATVPKDLGAGQVYVLRGYWLGPAGLEAELSTLASEAGAEGLHVAPLSDLR